MNQPPAAAESYETLYDFDSQMEEAFAEVLRAQTKVDCFVQRSEEELTTPRYECQFSSGAATEHYGKAKDGKKYPDGFRGTLRVRHVTARLEKFPHTEHRRKIALVRRYVYQFETLLSLENLPPYLKIESVLETGTNPSTDPEHELDITEINFGVAFYIRKQAWPYP